MRSTDIALILIFTFVFIIAELVVVFSAIPPDVSLYGSLYRTGIYVITISAVFTAVLLAMGGAFIDYDYPHRAIFDRIAGEDVRADKERWLKLQVIFQHITLILIISALINAFIGAGLAQSGGEYYFLSMFIIPVMTIIYLHSARNLLGMGYSELSCSSITGAKALSMLAFVLLNRRNKRGISYLLKSLNLFNETLRRKEIICDYLTQAHTYVSILKATSKELPYEQLAVLANDLSELNSLVNIPEPLSKFVKEAEISKLSAFKMAAPSKRLFFGKITIAIAFATAIGTGIQAIIPEVTKGQIVSWLVSAFTAPNFASAFALVVFMFLFLIVGVYLFERFTRVFVSDEDIGWKYWGIGLNPLN